ncbi:MAG: hypothetical protein Q7S65_01805 [Nanoarchaeota archaeon]|nr:hypothetical protein [Nanoarchaeota archaeon]
MTTDIEPTLASLAQTLERKFRDQNDLEKRLAELTTQTHTTRKAFVELLFGPDFFGSSSFMASYRLLGFTGRSPKSASNGSATKLDNKELHSWEVPITHSTRYGGYFESERYQGVVFGHYTPFPRSGFKFLVTRERTGGELRLYVLGHEFELDPNADIAAQASTGDIKVRDRIDNRSYGTCKIDLLKSHLAERGYFSQEAVGFFPLDVELLHKPLTLEPWRTTTISPLFDTFYADLKDVTKKAIEGFDYQGSERARALAGSLAQVSRDVERMSAHVGTKP